VREAERSRKKIAKRSRLWTRVLGLLHVEKKKKKEIYPDADPAFTIPAIYFADHQRITRV
jgi:hypothetical protein